MGVLRGSRGGVVLSILDRFKKGAKGEGEPGAEGEGSGGGAAPGAFEADAAKAAKFFERAKTVHESTNYEYATTLWLQGLRQDPTDMAGLEGFLRSAQAYAVDSGKDRPSKDQSANFGGKGSLEKYLEALLGWGVKPGDVGKGARVLEFAGELGLQEPGKWVGDRVLAVALNDKMKKGELVKLMGLLEALGAYDLAVRAGEAAVRASGGGDAGLESEVRNMAAQATMTRGGYEKTGEEGGFRGNIKDLEKQRRLEEEERLVKSEATVDRLVEAARADYESRPTDRSAIAKYARALQERGKPEDEKAAFELLMKAYQETKEFRFRQGAGELRLRHARRKVAELKERAKGGDSKAVEEHRTAHEKFLRMELEELKLRIENYPTDLGLKMETGIRHYLLGENEEAISLFQEARNDARNKGRALNYLGLSFLRVGWVEEAVATLREALEATESSDSDAGMDMRYNLMGALERKAREQKDLKAAEEAYRIASGIAIQQIGYRDVRGKRDELKGLVESLKGGG